MSEAYRGFHIDRCGGIGGWMWWSSDWHPLACVQFAPSPEAARRDIDEMLDEASEDLMIDLEMSIEALAFEKDANTL